MRMRTSIMVLVVLALGGTAAAEPPQPRDKTFAFAVNNPVSWIGATSLGGSLYGGLSKRHALRANVASYARDPGIWADMVAGLAGAEREASYTGRTTDVGVSWVFFARRLFRGPMLEAGALYRHRDFSVRDHYRDPVFESTQTRTIAVRGLVGWSWQIFGDGFLALAVGASVGHETGTQYSEQYDTEPVMPLTTRIDRRPVQLEGLLRVGWTFAP